MPAALGVVLAFAAGWRAAAQGQTSSATANATQAPAPQKPEAKLPPKPAPIREFAEHIEERCTVKNTGATMIATASLRAMAVAGIPGLDPSAGAAATVTRVCVPFLPMSYWYARFLTGPEVKALTPEQKGLLAGHNLLDPFNLLTIGGEAAISVGANSHSPYGPGFRGWSRYSGVSFTQDMTGEFFGTFLIPSIDHQDPHYHRMPTASIGRRVWHCVAQVYWTQGDDERGMVNYANLAGFAIDDAIGNLYVPGQQTNLSATADRYAIGLATAPIDNFVSEFAPDLARHIHIQVVVIQRLINRVGRTETAGQ